MKKKYEFIIMGGGLAGLSAAIHLSKTGYDVLLLERHPYPRHKVCGEYVSNEVLPYLKFLGFDPMLEGAVSIVRLQISTREGALISSDLPLGGFGLSRYHFDNALYEIARKDAEVRFETVTSVAFADDEFEVRTREGGVYASQYAIGAYGKRANLDKELDRDFIDKRSQWMAVKSHYQAAFPDDLVALHNFEGGYCGLSRTEDGSVNLCYLATLKSFNRYNDLELFEKKVLRKNPRLDAFLEQATAIFKKPLTISQISFQEKTKVEDHVLMLGDSAGLIHPLCGNGMAMAIHSAKLLCELFDEKDNLLEREQLERNYRRKWNKAFSNRLEAGSLIQRVLLNDTASKAAFRLGQTFPSLIPAVIRRTHGTPVA